MESLRGNEPSIPGYVLLGRLGSGGFGTVYAAVDQAGERVAIKVLRPELSDDRELLNRLEREGEALQQVVGDHSAKIHEVSTRGEYAYLVMDLIEGQNLEQHVRSKGPLKGFELRVVMEELVAALGEIHLAGVIHRDLKPSNVMYGPTGVTLLDFGISSIADSTALTKSGAFIGTAGWISPEQIEGRSVTAATDVFNLGLVIAYAATGNHPFGSGRPEGIMYRICHHEPELSELPDPVRGLVVECLNRDEARRVSVEQIRRVIESDFTIGWTEASHGPRSSSAGETVSPTRRIGRRESGSTERGGGSQSKAISTNVDAGRRTLKRGVVALASIAVVSAAVAVIALATSRSEPGAETSNPTAETEPTNSPEVVSDEVQTDSSVEASPPDSSTLQTTASSESSRDSVPLMSVSGQDLVPPKFFPDFSCVGPRNQDGCSISYFQPGERFTLWVGIDDPSGIGQVTFRVVRPGGGSSSWIGSPGCPSSSLGLGSGSKINGQWTVGCSVPGDAGSGDYLVEVTAIDESRSRNRSTFLMTTLRVARVSEDSEPPSFQTIRLQSSQVALGQSASVFVKARDVSGIKTMTAALKPLGGSGDEVPCFDGQSFKNRVDPTYLFGCPTMPVAVGNTYFIEIIATDWADNQQVWVGNSANGGIVVVS